MRSDLSNRMRSVIAMDFPLLDSAGITTKINSMDNVEFLYYLDLVIEMQKAGQS